MARSIATFKKFFLESTLRISIDRLKKVKDILKTIPNKENISIPEMADILSKKLSEMENTPISITNQTVYTWLSQKSIKDWRKEESKYVKFQDVDQIINNIPNRNKLKPDEMFDLLYSKYNIEMYYPYFLNLVKKGKFSDWIPFNTLREAKHIIGSMRNCNDFNNIKMLEILNNVYKLNINRNTFNAWIKTGKFLPYWNPK